MPIKIIRRKAKTHENRYKNKSHQNEIPMNNLNGK